jgi:hypothetical protein
MKKQKITELNSTSNIITITVGLFILIIVLQNILSLLYIFPIFLLYFIAIIVFSKKMFIGHKNYEERQKINQQDKQIGKKNKESYSDQLTWWQYLLGIISIFIFIFYVMFLTFK